MILERRQAHFYASVALAFALPILFLAGLLLRPTIPTADESVDELFAIANFPSKNPDPAFPVHATQLSDKGIQVFAAVTSASQALAFLDIQPQVIQFSDVLVYWQAGDRPPSATGNSILGDAAVLLGQLSGDSRRRFLLQAELQGQQGHLILYSRGQETLIATFPFTLAPNQE